MPDELILNKEHLTSFLRKIAREHRLIAPVKNRYGDTLFEEVSCLDDISLDLESRPAMPPTHFLLPQDETLFRYKREGGQYYFSEVLPEVSTVLFGLRSCDLWAIFLLDMVFEQDFKDPFYLNRRSNTILINNPCLEPMKNCFCKSAGSGPFLTEGYDLQFTDLGDRFLVEIGRPKGKALVEKWDYFFVPATNKDKNKQYEAILEAESRFQQVVDLNTASLRFINNEVDETLWEELATRCQGCGACTYVCPTCHCFNIADRPISETEGERIRTKDSCALPGFTRLAGGHNPRQKRSQRIRRRFYHKLAFAKEKYHRSSCVGCGRCVEVCFGHVDMIRVVETICEKAEKRSSEASLQLGEILVNTGLISSEELKTALEKQATTGKPLGTQFIDDGLLTRDEIGRALWHQMNIPSTAETAD